MRMLGLAILLAGLGLGIAPQLMAADKEPATQKAPSCCGEKCKDMKGCCKVDDKGKATCTMDGSCCEKTEKK